MVTVDVRECIACGAPTGLTPGGPVHFWFNRICEGCRRRTEESYFGPFNESTRESGPTPDVPPGAPWSAADVERAARYRLLEEEGGVHHVWPEDGPLPEMTVSCSGAGAFHARWGASRLVTMVRWVDRSAYSERLPPRWLEDVTPSPAKIASWLNQPALPAGMTHADHSGRRTETPVGRRPAVAIRTRDGWAIEVGEARGRSVMEGPDRDSRPAQIRMSRVRFKSPNVLGLEPDEEGAYHLPRFPGHLELKCGCGLAWRAGETTYSTAFDKLAAAGRDRIELRDLLRFAH